jgi:hypothetical protein
MRLAIAPDDYPYIFSTGWIRFNWLWTMCLTVFERYSCTFSSLRAFLNWSEVKASFSAWVTSEAGSETRAGLCCRGPNAACGDAAPSSSVDMLFAGMLLSFSG